MSLAQDIALSRRPLAGFVIIGLAWGAFSALVPPVKSQIGASDATYGLLILFASCGAIAAMWLAPLAFRWTGRWAMVLGSVMIAIGFVAACLATHPMIFAAAMLFGAMGTGVTDVLINAEIADTEAETDRALMNLNHGLYSFAFAGGAIVAGLLRDAGWQPWTIAQLNGGLILLLCGLMWTTRPPVKADESAQHTGHVPTLLLLLGGFIVFAAFLSEASTEGWSALHLERTLGADAAGGAMGPAIFGLMMGIGRFSGHAVSRYVSALPLMGVACCVAALGLTLAGLAPSLSLAYLGFALGGMGISVVVPLAFAVIGRSSPPELRLRAISRAAVMGYGAFFIGPPTMGFIAQVFGLPMSFLTIGVMLLLVGLFAVPAFARRVRLLA